LAKVSTPRISSEPKQGCRPWNYHEQLATIPAQEAWRPLEQGEYPLQITQRAGRPSNQACLSDLQAAAMPRTAPNAMLIAPLQPWANRGQRACDRQRSILQQPQRTVGCHLWLRIAFISRIEFAS